ncbi:MAG: class I SAM-dependent methyltransferase [Syntrophaceae bacterium]|nr:class I SAM-dependent methyltransferase [Syntrophaceae bacterium]
MSIDDLTLKYYSQNAAKVAERYNNVDSGLPAYFRRTLQIGARILDIGAGSGRDMYYLLKSGFDVYGVEPCYELRALALATYPDLEGRLETGSLPDIGRPYGGNYDAIVCSAVLMHVQKAEIFSSAYAIRENLKDKGRLLISLPSGVPPCG